MICDAPLGLFSEVVLLMPSPLVVIVAVSLPSASELSVMPGPMTCSVAALSPMRLLPIAVVEPVLADPLAADCVTVYVNVIAAAVTLPADDVGLASGQTSTPLIELPLTVHEPPETKTPM